MDTKAIAALRHRFGWTQAELAARLGTDAVTVSRWERGVSRPRSSAQARLRDLGTPQRGAITDLARTLGHDKAESILRRALLLSVHAPDADFAADPATRLRDVEQARVEQLELKRRIRIDR